MHLRNLVIAGLVVGGLSLAISQATAKPNMLQCEIVSPLLESLHDSHLEFKKPNKEIDERTVELYLEQLDPGRTLILASDLPAIEDRIRAAIKGARDGECSALDALHDDQVSWMKAMEEFVEATVEADDFTLDNTVELALDPDDRERPTTEADRKELWRKMVHYQIASYLSRDMEMEKARERLEHRYELLTKRVEDLEDYEVYGTYIDTVARALDPHTSYFSGDQLDDFRISMELSLEGIGAVLTTDDGYTEVREVVKGGAADRNKQLKSGDKIIAVTQGGEDESVDVIDMELRKVVKLIRGTKGTPVTLTVLREGETVKTLDITIVRDAIDLEERAASLKVEEREVDGKTMRLGVLDLPAFYGGSGGNARNSDTDVAALLDEARTKKLDGLVLDLSENGGGLLDHAVTITGYFIGTGPVVGVAGGGSKETKQDRDPTVQWDGPLVVLTSRASASASEILAGAVKDHARGVLVGDTATFGKGSVQNMKGLPEGLGALKVTTALFFRPSGESNQNTGVPVDVVVQSPYDLPFVGEATLPHPLPPRRIGAMNGGTPNPDGPGHWSPINDSLIKQLVESSAARVLANEDLQTLAVDLQKARTRTSVVKVAELLDGDKDEDKDKDEDELDSKKSGKTPEELAAETAEKDEDKDALSIQALEAINVLSDLVRLQRVAG